jgi:hypothetical protein
MKSTITSRLRTVAQISNLMNSIIDNAMRAVLEIHVEMFMSRERQGK